MPQVGMLLRLLLILTALQVSNGILMAADPAAEVGEFTVEEELGEVDYTWPLIKFGILCGLFLSTFLLVFFAIFPLLIRSARWWPRDACCWCWIWVWLLTAGYIIYLFEPDIVIPPGTTDIQKWGVEGAIFLAAICLVIYLYLTAKTPKTAKALVGEAKAIPKKA